MMVIMLRSSVKSTAAIFRMHHGVAEIACAEDAMNAAAERVTATSPTTALGAAALIRHVIEDMEINEDSATLAWPVSLLRSR